MSSVAARSIITLGLGLGLISAGEAPAVPSAKSGRSADQSLQSAPVGVICGARQPTVALYRSDDSNQRFSATNPSLAFPMLVHETANFRLRIEHAGKFYWIAAREVIWRRLKRPANAGNMQPSDKPAINGARGWQDWATKHACDDAK